MFEGVSTVAAQAVSSQASLAPDSPGILILSGLQKGYPIPDIVTESAYQRLRERGLPVPNIFVEYLDIPREEGSGSVRFKLMELRAKFEKRAVDAVIIAEDSALSYLEDPDIPILSPGVPVITTLTADFSSKPELQRPIINIFPGFAVARTLTLGLALFPETKRVFVVDGPGPQQAPIMPLVRAHFSELESPPVIEDGSDLVFDDMLGRVSHLPPDTLVLYGNYFLDSTGARFIPANVARQLSERSNSPVLGVYESHVLAGLLGGVVIRPQDLGQHAADVAYKILSDKRPLSSGITADPTPWALIFDWAQLVRWGASPDTLPSDTIFLNRPPSIWADYREVVMAAVFAMLLLALIVILLQRMLAARNRTLEQRNETLMEQQRAAALAADRLFQMQIAAKIVSWTWDVKQNTFTFSGPPSSGVNEESLPEVAQKEQLQTRIHPDDQERVTVFYNSILAEGAPKDAFVQRVQLGDGSIQYKELSGVIVERDAEGEVCFVNGLSRDISESVEQRLLLERQKQELASLAESAESAREAESRFLSNMSHEIRNPLNGVTGMLQLAIEETDMRIMKAQLRSANNSADHLKRIVDDILDFKKLEAGELEIKPEPFDYWAFREWSESIFGSLARAKSIDLQFLSEDDTLPRFVIGDKTRLDQIISNLLSNAIKFTPENGSITVSRSYDYENESLTQRIVDSGIGMSKETQDILFTRFKQASDGTTKHHQGTGLGLAISKQLLALMGGSIRVDSSLGEGSTFTVNVPLPVDWDRENAWREGRLEENVAVNAEPSDLSGVTILCVDDDPTNLSVLVPRLEKAGADVRVATSGRKALEVIERFDIDLVLTDISMPEMDGEQLLMEIRSRSGNMPVIAITGNVLQEDVRRYLATGFVAALGKPLDPVELFDVLDRFTSRQ